ncbi:hypothetical protein KFE98_20750 [bacterium SCSIO 12741]|nr:hypothetical protein KFE98_20750 [bacterium SCSIO 12741]
MKKRNIYLIIAGVLNLFTALLHLIGGQVGLVEPMQESSMTWAEKTQLLGVWHMVTALLFYSSFILLKKGFKGHPHSKGIVTFIGVSYLLYGLGFVGASVYLLQFAPQWTLLIPIGALALIGQRKMA